MRVGSAPAPPLAGSLFCRAAENKRDVGQGKERFSPTARTAFSSLGSSACPLSPPPGSSPYAAGHLTRDSLCLGHLCPERWSFPSTGRVLLVPSAAVSTCLALPRTVQRGCGLTHGSRNAFAGAFYSPSQSLQGVFYEAQNWSLKPLVSTGDSGARCKQSILC